MTLATTELFIALLTAHMLADFVFQTTGMVLNKKRPAALLMHGIHVFVLTALFSGGAMWLSLAIAASHIAIDAIKVYFAPDSLRTYLTDQAAHIAILLGVALWVPNSALTGLWPLLPPDGIKLSLMISGLIAASMAGGPAVGYLMARYKVAAQPQGLENAGRIIGLMERGLIYLMILIGEPAGIGFLIAAKSILRFDTVSKDQKISEYVIIGTLASFGWALAVSLIATSTLFRLGY
ncbi:DUF3307 domain-containing protein [Sulfitobacter sp. SK012]|uniref:DUF3307 domain-containing protein n=1 Tax=Sulfitobacter sp. SK012 TaxID=1389005 RepID=UPI000E0C5142|nr:DUF3307 domain-containing protein [Sulfitobacter sp. SK012]AXI46974.1 DUF3307 domain-containing protein [Sulfitobacter sp. SK012]